MKKFVIFFCFLLFALISNAQIFTEVKYLDKFDDVIKTVQKKTLVSLTDSTIIVEENGKKPVVYYILNPVPDATQGSKDEVVNLVGDVYGYQEAWCVVREDMIADYRKVEVECFRNQTKENMEKIQHYWIFAIHRTITTQYTQTYLNEYFWFSDESNDDKLGKSVNRIVYSR